MVGCAAAMSLCDITKKIKARDSVDSKNTVYIDDGLHEEMRSALPFFNQELVELNTVILKQLFIQSGWCCSWQEHRYIFTLGQFPFVLPVVSV